MPDPVGRSWLVDHLPEKAVTAVDIAILTPKSAELGLYLDQHLNSPPTLARVAAAATGTTRLRITRRFLTQMDLVRPDADTLARFAEIARPLIRLRTNLTRQNTNLRSARDLQLPRLVSGQLDTSELDIETEWLAS
jgi:type I restriction enzyme S subunit